MCEQQTSHTQWHTYLCAHILIYYKKYIDTAFISIYDIYIYMIYVDSSAHPIGVWYKDIWRNTLYMNIYKGINVNINV